jgi:stearoyl-CoA desaturase (delta-9 desaturase)
MGSLTQEGEMFRIYNVAGYVTLLLYFLGCTFIAPLHGNHWLSFCVGVAYFFVVWLLGGFYIGDMLHLGLAHRSLDVKPWFIHSITIVANTVGVYMDPLGWCNRHRLHHTFSDKPGDPNKLSEDGFWKTCKLMLLPYPSVANMLTEPVFRAWSLRLTSTWTFCFFAQACSYVLLWLVVGDWKYALVPWCGMRLVAAYIHIVQNYWTHEPRFGTRRYQDPDNAMNISNWLPVTLTFSACLQNNHHHAPGFVRLSHDPREHDFGFTSVRLLRRLGIALPTRNGLRIPQGAPLQEVGLS